MFGGKREKELEEALQAARESERQKQTALEKITKQWDGILERFAHMTASRSQVERDIGQIKVQLEHISALSENGSQAAGEVYGTLRELSNGVESFDANHTVFWGETKARNDKIMEIVEKNKHFTTPMKYISKTAQQFSDEQEKLHGRAARMMELSKNMSVISLNCAIEAGRMGETGKSFVIAAEEVRAFADRYEQEAKELDRQLDAADARAAELEEQVRHLNELLKENNISMTKLLKDSMQSLAGYEAGQLNLREMISIASIGKADALRQSGEERCKSEERILKQLDEIMGEIREQKQSADELESICQSVVESAKNGFRA